MDDNLSARDVSILNVMSTTPLTRAEIAAKLNADPQTGGVSESTVYRTLNELVKRGLVSVSAWRRGKELQYMTTSSKASMPNIIPFGAKYTGSGALESYPVSAYIRKAPENFDFKFTSDFGADLGQYPRALVKLMLVAKTAQAGGEFDREGFTDALKTLKHIKSLSEWLARTLESLLLHHSLTGNVQHFVDVWGDETTPEGIGLQEIVTINQALLQKQFHLGGPSDMGPDDPTPNNQDS